MTWIYPLLLTMRKSNRILGKNLFWIPGNGQQQKGSFERRETNKVGPELAQFIVQRTFRPQNRGAQTEPGSDLAELRRQNLEFGEDKAAKIFRAKYRKKERKKERGVLEREKSFSYDVGNNLCLSRVGGSTNAWSTGQTAQKGPTRRTLGSSALLRCFTCGRLCVMLRTVAPPP